jgi:isocitrate lyase
VTLAGFHALNLSTFELAHEYAQSGMSAYSELQQREFELAETLGYGAVKHQKFVGTGCFDEIANTITSGQTSKRDLCATSMLPCSTSNPGCAATGAFPSIT